MTEQQMEEEEAPGEETNEGEKKKLERQVQETKEGRITVVPSSDSI